jgi:dihydroxyacetone kinase
VAAGVRAAAEGVVAHGKAQLGDKTMVDALLPFADALDRGVDDGARLADAWTAAAEVAVAAAAATADLLPRMGRARPHAEKSLGTPDPGAHSFGLIAHAVGQVLAGSSDEGKEREHA